MSDVKRYDPNYAAISNADDLAVEADNGIFVMASDYDRLEQECERLRNERGAETFLTLTGEIVKAKAERDDALKQLSGMQVRYASAVLAARAALEAKP